MKLGKLPLLSTLTATAVALALAPEAAACEQCVGDGSGGEMCWSGFSYGSGSCYETYQPEGDECTAEGSCEDPSNDDWDTWDTYYCWAYGGSFCGSYAE